MKGQFVEVVKRKIPLDQVGGVSLRYIYINKAKRNLFAYLSGMAGHALYGMAPWFGHTGVTFDAENDRPGPGSLRGHFEAARGRFLRLKALF